MRARVFSSVCWYYVYVVWRRRRRQCVWAATATTDKVRRWECVDKPRRDLLLCTSLRFDIETQTRTSKTHTRTHPHSHGKLTGTYTHTDAVRIFLSVIAHAHHYTLVYEKWQHTTPLSQSQHKHTHANNCCCVNRLREATVCDCCCRRLGVYSPNVWNVSNVIRVCVCQCGVFVCLSVTHRAHRQQKIRVQTRFNTQSRTQAQHSIVITATTTQQQHQQRQMNEANCVWCACAMILYIHIYTPLSIPLCLRSRSYCVCECACVYVSVFGTSMRLVVPYVDANTTIELDLDCKEMRWRGEEKLRCYMYTYVRIERRLRVYVCVMFWNCCTHQQSTKYATRTQNHCWIYWIQTMKKTRNAVFVFNRTGGGWRVGGTYSITKSELSPNEPPRWWTHTHTTANTRQRRQRSDLTDEPRRQTRDALLEMYVTTYGYGLRARRRRVYVHSGRRWRIHKHTNIGFHWLHLPHARKYKYSKYFMCPVLPLLPDKHKPWHILASSKNNKTLFTDKRRMWLEWILDIFGFWIYLSCWEQNKNVCWCLRKLCYTINFVRGNYFWMLVIYQAAYGIFGTCVLFIYQQFIIIFQIYQFQQLFFITRATIWFRWLSIRIHPLIIFLPVQSLISKKLLIFMNVYSLISDIQISAIVATVSGSNNGPSLPEEAEENKIQFRRCERVSVQRNLHEEKRWCRMREHVAEVELTLNVRNVGRLWNWSGEFRIWECWVFSNVAHTLIWSEETTFRYYNILY